MSKRYDVVGIGNAIIDVIAKADDAFLETEDVAKGGMTLIDADRADSLYASMGPGIETSGGSAANTMAGCAALGVRGGFIGRVRDDQLGEVYMHDIRAVGVDFTNDPAKHGLPTARCLILVTPDGQRSMSTFLGASTELGVGDLDEDMIADSTITYMEGYLWDKEPAKQAFLRAMDVARAAGGKIALTLSDAFCVDMHRAEFLDLINGKVDVLFANEAEIKSLFETESFEAAVDAIRGKTQVAAITRSEKGAVILSGNGTDIVEAAAVDRVVDTTGAGDQFAAGFLAGLAQGRPMGDAGRMGAIAAAEVISHIGPRPQEDVGALINAAVD
ncbi:MAG: adenosine kinase [Pseudomonadota bacterium]